MGMFDLDKDVVEAEERDVSGGYGAVDADVYLGVIKMIYLDEYKAGSKNFNIIFTADSGKEHKETIYYANKEGVYTTEKDGKKVPTFGYNRLNSFLKVITEKGITEQDVETKTINVYDFDAKKELPKERKVLMDTINVPVAVGMINTNTENTTAESNYKDGTGVFKNINSIDKMFFPDTGLTVVERLAGETEPKYMEKWKKDNKGQVRLKEAKNPGAASGGNTPSNGASSASASTSEAPAPKKSLFG